MSTPDPVTPDPGERALVERLFAAYRAAKRDEETVDPIFQPGGGWKRVRDKAFAPLLEGVARDDLAPFHLFLANFGSWKDSTGIETSASFTNSPAIRASADTTSSA